MKEELVKYQLEQHQRNQEIDKATQYLSIPERAGFIAGVDWAEQHPREGLWDAEKVTEWLKVNLEKFGCFNCFIEDHKVEPDIIKSLREAMEE